MCGFIGRVGGGFDTDRALAWLGRRGPDGHQTWSAESKAVSLLHCRLAIVDQDSRSDQPFHDRAHGIAVALNGEIYNYRSLRRDYPDFPFRTGSDTETILAAYIEEGIAGLNRLAGMFAFVLVDERRGRVILARDCVGKKPLFVFRVSGALFFGSSLLPLIACSGADPAIDAAAAAFYWRRGYISPDICAVHGAWPVPPGIIVQFDFCGNEIARTRLEAAGLPRHDGEAAGDVKRAIRALLVGAVEQRLENNPHPAALLSGGIDSTLVTERTLDVLKRAGDGRSLKAITLGAMIPRTQDEYYARYAAKRLGLDLEIVRPARERLPDAVRRAVSVQDEPLGMPSYFFLFALIKAAAQHGKVLLTGDGGDEVFFGYRPPPDWQSHELDPGDESRLVRVGPGPAAWMGSWARDAAGNTLLGHMLTKIDRACAEQGVEVRCPLLDLRLMTYVRSLPAEMSYNASSPKHLLKEQLADWPQWFWQRRKSGFAYHLRWHWALTRFAGLREMISQEAIETFARGLSPALRKPARTWSTRDIFQHFGDAWRLMAWSAFLERRAAAMRWRGAAARDVPVQAQGLTVRA